MPANLPGLYFDEERNRYFPIASRDIPSMRAPSGKSTSTLPPRPTVNTDRRASIYHRIRNSTAGLYASHLAKAFRQTQEAQVARTRGTARIATPEDLLKDDLTALDVSDNYIIVGYRNGFLYRKENGPDNDSWDQLNYIEYQVTGVKLYGDQYLAVSFGPRPQIVIGNGEYATSLKLKSFHDVWAVGWSNEGPSDVVLGMDRQAVHIPSLESLRGMRAFPSKSDIYAVYKHGDQLFTGARNGCVRVFDIRAPPEQGITLWGPRTARPLFPAATDEGHKSAVANLNVVQEWKLVLNAMDGSLGVYDMRFTTARGSPNPILRLWGHANSCTKELGFSITPDANTVFAAGEDKIIRAWSLSSGEQLQPPWRDNEALLGKVFDEHVRAMSLHNYKLYATSGRDIWSWNVPFR